MFRTHLNIHTKSRGFYALSAKINAVLQDAGMDEGLCHVFLRHTSASLLVTENADPDVRLDLENFISTLVPDGRSRYRHNMEGADDMPAHIRSVLTQTEITVPIAGGSLGLGTWQEIYLWEHQMAPHQRQVLVTAF